MFCTKCSTQLREDANFCGNCGTPVATSPPAMARAAHIAAFDFSTDIERLTRDFTGREWFFKEVDQWLTAEKPRFMLLTANPGVGKSAIAARLTQVRADNLLAYHFCTASDSSTVVPNRIFRAIAAQLIDTLPGYGEVLANTIDAYRNEINVNIRVERQLGGKIVGVNIERLEASNPQEVLDILLRHPLQELNPPEQPQFVLIDSLDEAVTYSGGETLPRLLSKVDNLPNWVHFLCTSRPERRVLRHFDELEPYVLDAESQENLADTKQYITFRVVQPQLAARLREAQLGSDSFSEHVATLAKGNFLYTQVLLDDIAAGRQSLDDLAVLPQSLDEIYHQFLSRFTFDAWRDRYQPLFSVLAVARQPIRRDHLTQFTGIKATTLSQDLGIIQQFLTETSDAQGQKTYTLFHQSIRDYLLDEARNEDFWCAPQDCHILITEYYLRRHRGQWTQAPDDGYLFDNLAYHLDALADDDPRAADELKALFANQEWLRARFEGSSYTYDGYIADLMLAWERAHTEVLKQIKAKHPLTALADCVQYALIRTSLNSFNYEPPLVAQAVALGLWSPERAFGLASRVPDLKKRARIITAILAAREFDSQYAQALAQLGLETTLAIENELDRTLALAPLAPHLSGELLQEALAAAWQISEERIRAWGLTALTPQLQRETQENVLQEALAAARQISDKWSRAEVLSGLAPQLQGEAQENVLQEALAAARQIPDEETRARVLRGLAPHLSGELLQEALAAAWQISEERIRAWALTALAPQLQGKLLRQTLAAAWQISDKWSRAWALTALAPQLQGKKQKKVLQEALAAARQVSHGEGRARVLTALAPQLQGETRENVLQEALAAARLIERAWNRAQVLTALAPQLQGETRENVLQEALNVARLISREEDRAEALTDLAPQLQGELLQEALAAAQLIWGEWDRAWVGRLSSLERLLQEKSLPRALAAARQIPDEEARARVLSGLAPQLQGEARENVSQEALAVARQISDERSRAEVLTRLAPQLREAPQQMLDYLWQLQSQERRVLLQFLATEGLFEPATDTVPTQVVADIKDHIYRICSMWLWP